MNDELRVHYYSSIVHPFIAIFVPLWFFVSAVLVLINAAIVSSGAVVFPPYFMVLLLLVGVSETVTGNMLYKERIAGMLPRLRELVFVIIFGLFFILLFNGDIARGDVKLGRIRVWLPGIILVAEWFLSYYIHQKLREREIFLRFFSGKSEREIRETYQSFMHEGSESLKAGRSVKKLIFALMTLTFVVFLVMTWGFRFRYRGMGGVIILSFYIINMLIVSSINTWHEIQFIMMDGLVVNRGQRRFKMILIVLLLAAVCLLALPFVGSSPLLPESYLAAFFAWLQSIGRFEVPDRQVEAPDLSFGRPNYDVGNYLGQVTGDTKQPGSLAAITRIIGWIVLIGLITGAVVFLLRPLFRSGVSFRPKDLLARLLSSLRKNAAAVGSSLRSIVEAMRNRRKLRVWEKIGSRGMSGRSRAGPESGAAALRSRRERREQGRMLKAFFKLTRWGEKRGVPFRTSMGPAEYTARLQAAEPEHGEECGEIAVMFEEALFSNHERKENFHAAFAQKVRRLTRA